MNISYLNLYLHTMLVIKLWLRMHFEISIYFISIFYFIITALYYVYVRVMNYFFNGIVHGKVINFIFCIFRLVISIIVFFICILIGIRRYRRESLFFSLRVSLNVKLSGILPPCGAFIH